MYVIDDILISDEIFSENFACNLAKCKGACCWEGDFGAPLEKKEVEEIDKNLTGIKKHMDASSIDKIQEVGFHEWSNELKKPVTTLMRDGACVFMTRDKAGIAQCSIERAHKSEDSDFKKPLSCHLYPIRITTNPHSGFESMNYDRWDICQEACVRGESMSMPVFRFVKDALIRRYGSDFYEKMETTYNNAK